VEISPETGVMGIKLGEYDYICNLHRWDISYFYVVPAVIFYAGATIVLTYIPSHEGSDAMWVITEDWPVIKFGPTSEVFKTSEV